MSVLQIRSLIDYLKNSHLPDNWITQHSWSSADAESSKSLVLNSILSASVDILKHHSLILLSGEYAILPSDAIKTNLDELEIFLTDRSQLIEISSDESIQNEIQDFFIKNIVDLVRIYIYTRLSHFDRDLKKQLLLDDKKKLLRAQKRSSSIFSEDETFKDYRILFSRILALTKLEHFNYYLAESTIGSLLLIKTEVENLNVVAFIRDATIAKIEFLQKKLFYRNKERDNRLRNLIYSFELQPDYDVDLESIHLDGNLISWSNDIEIHYGFVADYKKQQRKKVSKIYEGYDVGTPLVFDDFRALIKKFKDDSKSLENVTILLSQFKDIRIASTSIVDVYAKRVSLSYLFNNSISLKLEDYKLNATALNDIYQEIRNQQNDDDIKNYFPWKRLAEVLTSKIDVLADDLGKKEKFEAFQELLKLYPKVISKMDESLKWCITKSFIPFQLPFDECKSNYQIVTDRHGTFQLYFFSSLILPLCYESIAEEIEQLNLKKVKYDTLLATYKKLRKVVEDVEDTSNKLRNLERRSIEVLAIFSAISLFSVGSIQIFSTQAIISDPNVYYKFIFSYGYSLILFVLIIWVITRDNIKKIQAVHWIIIITLILTSLFVIAYFVGAKLPF